MLHDFEIEEFAQELLGLPGDPDTGAASYSEIEDALYEKYEISLENFTNLLTDIFPFIDKAPSGMTGVMMKGFAKDLGEGRKRWILKEPNTK